MARQRLQPATRPGAALADDRRYVTALARGLAVLRCFSANDRWLAHQEIARRTGLPQATVSRLAFTLTSLGYLQHRVPRGEYALAPGVLALGFSMLGNFDIGRIARPYMQALADQTQAAVSLGVRHELSMVYVAHCRSSARLSLGLDVGASLPLASTAMGRALLVALSDDARAQLGQRLRTEQPIEWPRWQSSLPRALAQHAAQGFVSSEGEWHSDITAVGAAVCLADGREPLALTVGGAASRLHGALLHEDFGPAVRGTALQISAALHNGDWSA